MVGRQCQSGSDVPWSSECEGKRRVDVRKLTSVHLPCPEPMEIPLKRKPMHKSLSARCIAVLAAALSPVALAQSTSSFSAELQAKYRVIPNITYLTAKNYQ